MKANLYRYLNVYFVPLLVSFIILTQAVNSQTWIRKVDGFSMWSIAKDYAGNIYAGTTGTNRGIFKSSDGGETWTNMLSTGASNYLGIACDSLNNVYVANGSNGLLISTDGGQNFELVPSSTFNGNTLNMVACGRNGHIFAGATNGGIWRSTDFGNTFTNTALQSITIVTIAVNKNNPDMVYAGASSTSTNGFYISTDGGLTFGPSTNSINVWEVLQTADNTLYTATTTSPYPFDRSTDGGLTWTTMSNQPGGAARGATLDLVENIYTAGNGGVFKSTNSGASFVNHNLTFSSNKIISYSNKIMVCVSGTTNGGVWIYTDDSIPVELASFTASVSGNSVNLYWRTASEVNNAGYEIERASSRLIGTSPRQDEWEKIGFVEGKGTTTESTTYSFVDNNLTPGSYQYRIKQIDFDGSYNYYNLAESVEIGLPDKFELAQNFPNPFNPSTVIKYQVPSAVNVSLKVYDIIGNEVAVLVNEVKPAGYHSIEFNQTGLASGIYLYKLQAGSFTETKKMMLLK